jgi:hypothetical protein
MPAQFQRFEPDGPCDRLLPANAIRNVLAFYRVTSFAYDGLLEDVFTDGPLNAKPDRSDLVSRVAEFKLALPTMFYANADPIHEVTRTRDVQAAGAEITLVNDGVFLPFKGGSGPRPTAPRKVVTVRDFSDIDDGALTFRGRSIAVDASL